MKHRTVDDLLNDKGETPRETVRPNISIEEAVWDDFRFTLEYVNINRATKLYAHDIIQASLVEFVEKAKVRTKSEEGTVNGYMMFMADKRLEKQLSQEKKTKVDSESDKAPSKKLGSTLSYTRKTVKRKASDDE